MEPITEEYKQNLEGLKPIDLNIFINQIKTFKDSKDNYFKKIDKYIKEFIPIEFLNIILKEEFIKIFYLDSQAKYIKENLNLSQDLDIIKTMVYCYNDYKREFEKNIKEEKLKKELLEKGFKEQEVFLSKEERLKDNYKELEEKFINEKIKPLHNKKVICVFDRNKMGMLGSFTEKQEHEGTLIFNSDKGICFLPKRHTKTGQILTGKFYYKDI